MPRIFSPDSSSKNILIRPLGPVLGIHEAMTRMTNRPPFPKDVAAKSRPHRLHELLSVRDFHIPSEEEGMLQRTIDMLVRQALVNRDPTLAPTWLLISAEDEKDDSASIGDAESYVLPARPRSKAMAAAVSGIAGSGKTEGIHRSLMCYPGQVVRHPKFPKLLGCHHQIVWISIDAPGSGKPEDLAEALMLEWDVVMGEAIVNYTPRFADTLAKGARNGQAMLSEWRSVASAHFLALLHVDEVQNLFKLGTLKQRRRKNARSFDQKLSIAEDRTLRWILTLINRWGISVIFSGTPDGIGAMTTRLATSQRLSVGGYHPMLPFLGPDDPAYRQFIDILARYQWMVGKLPAMQLYEPLFRMTAGVRRLIIALWVSAHRIALDRTEDELRVSDFDRAATTLLAPTQAGVHALLSRSPDRFELFEDLKPGESFWTTFWSEMGR